jgi:hypothetical protein
MSPPKMLMELADSLETKRVRLVLVHISAEVEAFLLSMGGFNTRTRRHVPDAPTKTVRHVRLSGEL